MAIGNIILLCWKWSSN